MVKVSILIPVYNTEKYLEKCLSSVENQTLTEIEIICINDGSKDNSLDIIKKHQSIDPRIKIVDKEHTGYGHSMNQGLKTAVGEYIGIVESDDFADEGMFEYLYRTARENDAEIVKSNYWHHYGEGSDGYCEMLEGCPYDKVISLEEAPQIFFKNTNLWSSIYRRDFLLENEIWFNETPGAAYQDVAFTLKTLACASRVYLVNEAFLHYRMDNAGSSINSKEKVYCDCDEFAEMWRFLNERHELKEKVKYLLPRTMLRIYKWNYHRIHERFRKDFLQRVLSEFQELHKNGLLCREYWDEESWHDLQRMMQTPARINYEKYSLQQKSRLLQTGLLVELNTFSDIFLFGAGKVGKEVLGWLQKHNISVAGVLVSDPSDNPQKIMDVSVCSLLEIKPKKDRAVIVALTESSQYDILSKLNQIGWSNIITADADFRRCLRYQR